MESKRLTFADYFALGADWLIDAMFALIAEDAPADDERWRLFDEAWEDSIGKVTWKRTRGHECLRGRL